jgi:hypothetical protein
MLGGASGHVRGGWLDLAPLRLMEPFRVTGCRHRTARSPQRGRSQGCRGVHPTTSGFRAKGFHGRPTYEVMAPVPAYPPGHTYNNLQID